MLSNWIIFSSLVSLALFVLPFKMPRLEYVAMRHPKSLLRVFLKEARWKRGGSLRVNLLRLGFVMSLLVVFLPPMMLVQFQQLAVDGGFGLRLAIFIEAVALLLGCALSVLAILLSDMVISIGASTKRSTITPVAWMVPMYEISFALGSMVGALVVG